MTSLTLNERPSRSFARIVGCGCGAVGGFAAGHMGCLTSIGFAIAMGSGVGATGLMAFGPAIAISLSLTALGLGAWYLLRKDKASLAERILIPVTSAIGLGSAVFMHTTEAGHNFVHTHIFETITGHSAAELWLDNLTAEELANARILADTQGISLLEYAESVCSAPIQYNDDNKSKAPDLKVLPS